MNNEKSIDGDIQHEFHLQKPRHTRTIAQRLTDVVGVLGLWASSVTVGSCYLGLEVEPSRSGTLRGWHNFIAESLSPSDTALLVGLALGATLMSACLAVLYGRWRTSAGIANLMAMLLVMVDGIWNPTRVTVGERLVVIWPLAVAITMTCVALGNRGREALAKRTRNMC